MACNRAKASVQMSPAIIGSASEERRTPAWTPNTPTHFLILTRTHTYPPSLSLSHTHSLSLSHTHTHSLPLTYTHTHTRIYQKLQIRLSLSPAIMGRASEERRTPAWTPKPVTRVSITRSGSSITYRQGSARKSSGRAQRLRHRFNPICIYIYRERTRYRER